MAGKTMWESMVEDGCLGQAIGEGCLLPLLLFVGFGLLIGLIDLILYFPGPTLSVLALGVIWLVFIKRWD